MKNPLVSIIIPVYKVEQYIDKCIKSVINQTYQDLDIILVDDGSPDNCPQICDAYAEHDKRIRVIHKDNAGLGMARNSGLSIARGEYVTFLDSDDWIEKDRIEHMITPIIANDYDAVIAGYTICSNEGEQLFKQKLIEIGEFEKELIKTKVLLQMICAPPSNPNDDTLPIGSVFKLYSMRIIRDNKLQFISEKKCLAEDVFFNTEFFSCCSRIRIIEEYGYYYRMNPKSISNTYTTERADRGFVYYDNLMKLISDKGLLEQGRHIVERSYIGKCRVALKLIVNTNQSLSWKRQEIRKILNHPYTVEALRSYPINNYNFGLRLTAYIMRKKSTTGTYICFLARRLLRKAN